MKEDELFKMALSCLLMTLPQFFFNLSAYGQPSDAESIIQSSIDYHDPDNLWQTKPLSIKLNEKRPNGMVRKTQISLDLSEENFGLIQVREGHQINVQINGSEVDIRLNGKPPSDSTLITKYRLSPERQLLMRDYYTYLYGLPMKLQDSGTIVDPELVDTTFEGLDVYQVKVTYSEEVGNDTWYFYFDKNNARLVGYRFYHDESKNDGEYITLAGEAKRGSFRIPKARKWYTHQGNKFLGEDVITDLR